MSNHHLVVGVKFNITEVISLPELMPGACSDDHPRRVVFCGYGAMLQLDELVVSVSSVLFLGWRMNVLGNLSGDVLGD